MTAAARTRFYDGTPGHELGACPDCGHACDSEVGNHFGICLDRLPITPRSQQRTGPQVIREAARRLRFLSINSLRAEMTREGVPESKRGPAFAVACKRGWIEHVGFEPSTDPGTKRHNVKVYRSLLCPAAASTTTEGR